MNEDGRRPVYYPLWVVLVLASVVTALAGLGVLVCLDWVGLVEFTAAC